MLNRLCLRDAVAFTLGIPPEDVPDCVRAMPDGSFNSEWESELTEWTSARGIGMVLMCRRDSGWDDSEYAVLESLSINDCSVSARM